MEQRNLIVSFESYKAGDATLPAADLRLIEQAKAASRCSYADYSHFHVGAALLLADGTVVQGSNQENAAFGAGCCAERTALYYAGTVHAATPVVAIAVAAWRESDGAFLEQPVSPCGICRQHLVETEQRYQQPIRVILYGTGETYVLHSAKDLLPFGFTAKDL